MKLLSVLALLLVAQVLFAADHAAYDTFLQKHVQNARIDYKGLLANKEDLDSFRTYLKTLSETDPASLSSDADRKAFWINAYNAFTIELILRHYPIKSIRDIGILDTPWRKSFFKINGKEMSLNDIEHGTLRKRKEFLDARVHFALVCASKGCPPLQSFAFTGEKLDEQLESIARSYLTDPQKTTYDAATDTLRLNSIMKWYGGDFERDAGSLRKFIRKYLPLISDKTKIEFLTYDWSLNEVVK